MEKEATLNRRTKRALNCALGQGACWAVMFGIGENSLALMATYLHAPAVFFGFLAGIPQLIGPLFQAFAAGLLDRYPRRRRLILGAVTVQALSFAPLALMAFGRPGPLLHFFFLICGLVYYMAGHFMNPPWTSLVGDLVPTEQRSAFFARNFQIVSLITLLSQLAMGLALYWGREVEGLQWVFSIGMALSGMIRIASWFLIRRLPDVMYQSRPDSIFSFWQFIRRIRESNFARFVLFVALLHFGVQIAGPYFLPYWIYTLGYKEWQWMVLSGAAVGASAITLLLWGSFSERFGNKRTLIYSSYGISLTPVSWLISDNLYFLTASNAFSGILWAGFGLSSWNYLLEAVSPPKRARCSAYYNIVLGFGVFSGALVGAGLARVLPLEWHFGVIQISTGSTFPWLLGISILARLSACLLLLSTFRELRTVEPFSLRNRLFEFAQIRVPLGVRFNVVPQKPEKPHEPDAP